MAYDLVVIGGGIIGAGVARDAALRGLKVALFEAEDYASGTTSRSTRLIHGGLRYLSKYDFALVHEALTERRALLSNAPHLVRPLPFLLPMYRGHGHPLPILWLGVALYDLLDPRRTLPHHRHYPAKEALEAEPVLKREGLRGAFLYYDSQCAYPERLCLENVLDAQAHGARVENHARVTGLLREGGRVEGVRVGFHDGHEEEVRARLTLNCSGPWLDEVERLALPEAEPRLRRTKGVHLVLPRFTTHAVIFETQEADRVVFAIPWGDRELVGTTDTDFTKPNEEVRAEEDDIDYLLRELNAVVGRSFTRADVSFTTAGLRPLQRQVGRSTADITRRHELVDHGRTGGPDGYVTVVGGKITTFRHIAEEVVDHVMRRLDRGSERATTLEAPLPGAAGLGDLETFRSEFRKNAHGVGIAAAVADHLVDLYGVRAALILDTIAEDPSSAQPIHPGSLTLLAEVDHAVLREGAKTVADVLLRRTMAGLDDDQARPGVEAVAQRMAARLGWDEARRLRDVQDYAAALERNWVTP